MYVSGRLFRLIATSNNTSSSSHQVNNDSTVDLYRLCFVNPVKRSYCPPHHVVFERLNFQIILFLLKKSCNCSSLLILFNHFVPVFKIFVLSEYMMFGFRLLEINFLKLLINLVLVISNTNTRCTALLTLQENKIYPSRSVYP